VLCAAPRAAADDTPPPAPADQPAPEPPDTVNDFEWDFRWDDGLVYELWVLTPELQSKLQNADKLNIMRDLGITGRVGGSLFLDYGFVSGEGLGNSWDVELRRLRLETFGHVSHWFETDYKVSFGAEQQRAYLNDFWFAWRPGWISDWVDRIRLGYIDPPFSIQQLTTSTARSFMEVPAPVAAFAPGYRLGLEFRDRLIDPFKWSGVDLTWISSLSSVGQSQQFSDASSSPFRFSLRAALRPGGVSQDSEAPLTHLALAIGYSFSGAGDVRYRSRSESSLTPYLVDTGDIHGDAGELGLEFARRDGPLRIEAEWIGSWVAATSGDRFFSGSYVEFGWSPTGEVRPYDPGSAIFLPGEPRESFSFERGTWGGLELASRIAYVDLSDQSTRGGRMLTLSTSSVWSLNKFMRVHFDLIYADVKDRPRLGSNLIAQMRLELQM
jgi:phosphate-selective porin